MSTRQFFLRGDDPSSACSIAISCGTSDDDLQHLVASTFAVVEPQEIGYAVGDIPLASVAEVLASTENPIAVTIGGRAVHDVPGPKGLPWIGTYLEVYPDHLGNHQRLFEKYGSIFRTNNLGSTVYHVNDPQLANIICTESPFFSKRMVGGHPIYPIKNDTAGVFLSDTDTEAWRLAHKFLPPALGPKAVRCRAPHMQETVERAFAVFDELDERGESWNVYSFMLKLASQAIGEFVLGMDFQHFTSVDAGLHDMVESIGTALELNKRVSSRGSWYRYLPFGDPQRLRVVRGRILTMMMDTVEQAAEAPDDLDIAEAALKSNSVIDYLLCAKDAKGSKMPPDRIVEPLVVMTAAGFTTTASLLSWLIYSAIVYPGMQDRLVQELADKGFSDDTQVTPELLQELEFLDKFVKETLRRHPPAYQPARTASVDMILPGGFRLPKDAVCILAIHHIHHNAAIWDNPTHFDPDRWDTQRVKDRPTASYVPFATGPRMCIGFNFALQEAKLFIAKLIWRYKFSQAEEGVPIEYDPMFQVIRPNNLYVRADRRRA